MDGKRSRPSLAHHPFVKTLVQSLRQRCGVEEHSRLLVAVSGGADSVALLRALHLIAPRRTWHFSLSVAHVQHHLREQAESDAAFVEQLAGELHLPYLRTDLDPSQRVGNLEAWARRARYAALTAMATQSNCSYVVAAHHGGDQLETVLMRLLRGSSVTGLAGMAWRRPLVGPARGDASIASVQKPMLIRPMLGLDREQATKFLADIRQPWREDHTNADVSRLRARLRHEVLPALHTIQNDLPRNITRLTDHLRDVADLIERASDETMLSIGRDEQGHACIDRAEARTLPRVVLAAMLRKSLCAAGVPADHLTTSRIMPIVRAVRDHRGGVRTFELSQSIRVQVTRENVIVQT